MIKYTKTKLRDQHIALYALHTPPSPIPPRQINQGERRASVGGGLGHI